MNPLQSLHLNFVELIRILQTVLWSLVFCLVFTFLFTHVLMHVCILIGFHFLKCFVARNDSRPHVKITQGQDSGLHAQHAIKQDIRIKPTGNKVLPLMNFKLHEKTSQQNLKRRLTSSSAPSLDVFGHVLLFYRSHALTVHACSSGREIKSNSYILLIPSEFFRNNRKAQLGWMLK